MRKAPSTTIIRLTALALAVALTLPNPAFALRTEARSEAKGGLEELEQALQPIVSAFNVSKTAPVAAGLEESPLGVINQHLLSRSPGTSLSIAEIPSIGVEFTKLSNHQKQDFTSAMLLSSRNDLDITLPAVNQSANTVYYITGPASIDLTYSVEDISGQAVLSPHPIAAGIGVGLKAAAASQFGLRAQFIGMSRGPERQLFNEWAKQIGETHFIDGPTRTVVYLSPQKPDPVWKETLVLNPSANVNEEQAEELIQHVLLTLPQTPENHPFVVWNVGHAFAGVSAEFDAQLIGLLKEKYRVVIDFRPNVKKEAMGAVFKAGPFMVKPNLGEIATYLGEDPSSLRDISVLASKVRTIAESNNISVFVVSLAEEGALVVYRDAMGSYQAAHVPGQPLDSPLISEGAAGDSLVAAILFKLSQGIAVPEAVAYGVATGTETVLLPGTATASREAVERRFQRMRESSALFQPISLAGLEEPGRSEVPPERRAVVFGAGRIGRGRLGPWLSTQNDFDVIFVDHAEQLIAAINQQGRYSAIPMGDESATIEVRNIWGIPLSDTDQITAQGPRADWVFTSVRAENVPSLAPILRGFIQKRIDAGHSAPLNIVFAENLPVDQPQVEQVRQAVLQDQSESFRRYVEEQVGFVGAIVQGGVPEKSPVLDNALSTYVKPGPSALLLDADAIRGPPPSFQGDIKVVKNIRAHREKKLLVHNMVQAMLAYLAAVASTEMKESREAIQDVRIVAAVALALQESVTGLAARYPGIFESGELDEYAREFLTEYADPEFTISIDLLARDPVRKLAPTERFFAAAQNARDAGISPDAIALGIAAARFYATTHAKRLKIAPEQVDQLNQSVEENAARLGISLPENTAPALEEAWNKLVGETGKPEVTVSQPITRKTLSGYDALVRQEKQAILEGRQRKGTGIYWAGSTGPVAAGKTGFLTALENDLREAGTYVVHLTEDELGVIDRATRSQWEQTGDPRWNEWRNWIRWEKILKDIQKLNDAAREADQTGQPQLVLLEHLYNRASGGTTDGTRTIEIRPGTIVVYDGILLTEKYPQGTFDRITLFDVTQQESLRRSILRDFAYGRDPRTVLRYNRQLYNPLWVSYVSRFHPEQAANAVYDLTDFNQPIQLFYRAAGLEEEEHWAEPLLLPKNKRPSQPVWFPAAEGARILRNLFPVGTRGGITYYASPSGIAVVKNIAQPWELQIKKDRIISRPSNYEAFNYVAWDEGEHIYLFHPDGSVELYEYSDRKGAKSESLLVKTQKSYQRGVLANFFPSAGLEKIRSVLIAGSDADEIARVRVMVEEELVGVEIRTLELPIEIGASFQGADLAIATEPNLAEHELEILGRFPKGLIAPDSQEPRLDEDELRQALRDLRDAGLEEEFQNPQWQRTHAKIVEALRSHPGGRLTTAELAELAGVSMRTSHNHGYRSLVVAENERRAGMKPPRPAIEVQEQTENPLRAIVEALRSHPGGRLTTAELAELAGVSIVTLYNHGYRSLVVAENERRAGMKRPRPAIEVGVENTERAIVEALRSHPGGRLTTAELAELAGVSRMALHNHGYRSLVVAENERRAAMKSPRPAIEVPGRGRPRSAGGLEELDAEVRKTLLEFQAETDSKKRLSVLASRLQGFRKNQRTQFFGALPWLSDQQKVSDLLMDAFAGNSPLGLKVRRQFIAMIQESWVVPTASPEMVLRILLGRLTWENSAEIAKKVTLNTALQLLGVQGGDDTLLAAITSIGAAESTIRNFREQAQLESRDFYHRLALAHELIADSYEKMAAITPSGSIREEIERSRQVEQAYLFLYEAIAQTLLALGPNAQTILEANARGNGRNAYEFVRSHLLPLVGSSNPLERLLALGRLEELERTYADLLIATRRIDLSPSQHNDAAQWAQKEQAALIDEQQKLLKLNSTGLEEGRIKPDALKNFAAALIRNPANSWEQWYEKALATLSPDDASQIQHLPGSEVDGWLFGFDSSDEQPEKIQISTARAMLDLFQGADSGSNLVDLLTVRRDSSGRPLSNDDLREITTEALNTPLERVSKTSFYWRFWRFVVRTAGLLGVRNGVLWEGSLTDLEIQLRQRIPSWQSEFGPLHSIKVEYPVPFYSEELERDVDASFVQLFRRDGEFFPLDPRNLAREIIELIERDVALDLSEETNYRIVLAREPSTGWERIYIRVAPSTGLEEQQQAFRKMLEDPDWKRHFASPGFVALDTERKAALDILAEAMAFIVSDETAISTEGHKIFADNRLTHADRELLIWTPSGTGAQEVVQYAKQKGAKRGDLLLIPPDAGVDIDQVEALLRKAGYSPDLSDAPRVVIAGRSQVEATALSTLWFLASHPELPRVVFLNVGMKLTDEAGNSYTLIVMA